MVCATGLSDHGLPRVGEQEHERCVYDVHVVRMWPVVVAVTCGCGRVGFDPLGDANAAGDGAVVHTGHYALEAIAPAGSPQATVAAAIHDFTLLSTGGWPRVSGSTSPSR
jgi:hypothetical protein